MVQITANATNSPVNVPVIIHPNVQSTQRIKLHAGAAVHHHTVSGYALAGRQRGQPGRSRARHTQRGAVQIPVTFTITTAVSNLVLSPPTLYFNFQIGGGAPQEQTIAVNSTRADALAFTAAINSATGASWLGICSTSGTTPGFSTSAWTPRTSTKRPTPPPSWSRLTARETTRRASPLLSLSPGSFLHGQPEFAQLHRDHCQRAPDAVDPVNGAQSANLDGSSPAFPCSHRIVVIVLADTD